MADNIYNLTANPLNINISAPRNRAGKQERKKP